MLVSTTHAIVFLNMVIVEMPSDSPGFVYLGSTEVVVNPPIAASERTCNNISFTYNASLKRGHLRRDR